MELEAQFAIAQKILNEPCTPATENAAHEICFELNERVYELKVIANDIRALRGEPALYPEVG